MSESPDKRKRGWRLACRLAAVLRAKQRPFVSFALAVATITAVWRFTDVGTVPLVVASLPLIVFLTFASKPSQFETETRWRVAFVWGMWAAAVGPLCAGTGPVAAIGLGVAYALIGFELGSVIERHRRPHDRGRVLCRECGAPIHMRSFVPYIEALHQFCPNCKRRRRALHTARH